MDVLDASRILNRLGGRMRLTRRFIFLPGAEACLSDSRDSACQKKTTGPCTAQGNRTRTPLPSGPNHQGV
jgi:hypothetical protein